eukprot:361809-Chlamydomonas_euryale.AAC.3
MRPCHELCARIVSLAEHLSQAGANAAQVSWVPFRCTVRTSHEQMVLALTAHTPTPNIPAPNILDTSSTSKFMLKTLFRTHQLIAGNNLLPPAPARANPLVHPSIHTSTAPTSRGLLSCGSWTAHSSQGAPKPNAVERL